MDQKIFFTKFVFPPKFFSKSRIISATIAHRRAFLTKSQFWFSYSRAALLISAPYHERDLAYFTLWLQESFMTPLLLFALGVALIVIGLRLLQQPLARDAISQWHTPLLPQVSDDPQTVYARIYQGLKAGLEERQVELKGMGFGPIRLFETKSIFSARPLYFCAKYKHLTYYIYGMATPYGLFLSTWLFSKHAKGRDEQWLLPIGFKYKLNETLFQHDAVVLFQTMMHNIVLEVVESYRRDTGMPPLQEYEKRPVYSSFYEKSFPPAPPFQSLLIQPNAGQQPVMQQPMSQPSIMTQPVMQHSPAAMPDGHFPQSSFSQPPFPFGQHFNPPDSTDATATKASHRPAPDSSSLNQNSVLKLDDEAAGEQLTSEEAGA
jgi:hypothetical protein